MDGPPWLPPPSRSRSSLLPRGSTPSGSEAPSWLPSPPSSRCGSPSRSTTSAAHPSSTASASKRKSLCFALLSNPWESWGKIGAPRSDLFLLLRSALQSNFKNRSALQDPPAPPPPKKKCLGLHSVIISSTYQGNPC